MTVEERIEQSRRDFERVVWPAIGDLIGGGELLPVEGLPDALARQLDQAGIDYYQIRGEGAQHPTALCSRVQYHPNVYPSFTVRMVRGTRSPRTELLRLLRAHNLGQLSGWFCQAYLDWPGGPLLHAGVVPTDQLTAFVDAAGIDDVRTNSEDGSLFAVIWWNILRHFGADLRTTDPLKPCYRRPDLELLPHESGEGWDCPRCGQSAGVFFGSPGTRVCRESWHYRP